MPTTSSTSPLYNTAGSCPGTRNQVFPQVLSPRWLTISFTTIPASTILQPERPQAHAFPLGLADLLKVVRCHNLSAADRCLSHRSLNPFLDATGKYEEKASSTHANKTVIASGGVRAGNTPPCISELCVCWWHKGTKSDPAAGQHQLHYAPDTLLGASLPCFASPVKRPPSGLEKEGRRFM